MQFNHKKCFILDLDGTVYLGDIPITGTVEFIKKYWNSIDFRFLSNNTSKAPATYLTKLAGLGIPATLDNMLFPTTPLVAHLRQTGITKAYLVGNKDYTVALQQAMPELVLTHSTEPDGAEAVILAYDTELDYDKLCKSALLLQKENVHFLATHPDLVCPSPAGPLPDIGSFFALYEKATNRTPSHIFGKPHTAVLAPLYATYTNAEMVMVGDRLATDKKLAENAGMDFILVLSGEAQLKDLKHETVMPTISVNHLGELDMG